MSSHLVLLPRDPTCGCRNNHEAARVIEAAIELQGRRGKLAAARFLAAYGASFSLTVRVLSEPQRRRAHG